MTATSTAPRRLERLPVLEARAGLRIVEADGVLARALGLALLRDMPHAIALHIPRCRSVHTVGMRFALDVVFLGADREPVRVLRSVRPWHVVGCRRARSVIEARAGEADRFLALLL